MGNAERFSGRVALVTGGSSGIGAAVARRLQAEGARVASFDLDGGAPDGALALTGDGEAPTGFILGVSVWLWLTVLFANFAEAMAEGRGKAQAETLRKARKDVTAKRLAEVLRAALSSIGSQFT